MNYCAMPQGHPTHCGCEQKVDVHNKLKLENFDLLVNFNALKADYDKFVKENDLLRKVTHISIPTATMEQEFAKHYNQGFAAGLKRTDEIQKNISNISLNLLREIMQEGDMKFELGLNLFNKVEMWLKDNQR